MGSIAWARSLADLAQGTNATEGGTEVLLAISRELRESREEGP